MKPEENLKSAIDTMCLLLSLTSGASDFQLREAAYYAAATWHLHAFNRFPHLALYGPSGAGKSVLLETLELFCYAAVMINISSGTKATLRENFAKASPGTAILEESEDETMTSEIEAYLKNRFAVTTAKASKMTPTGTRGWEKKEYETFGATIIHRRDHFSDQALENRCIWLNIQQNLSRSKSSYFNVNEIPKERINEVRKSLEETAIVQLPDADAPDRIPGRIVDVYEPLLRLAKFVDDKSFLDELINEMDIASAAFRDGQTFTPKALVLKALIGCLTLNDQLNLKMSVCVERDICRYLQNNFMQGMKPRPACKYLRELGFDIRQSGGVNKVVGITVPQLAKACRDTGIVDELVAKAAKGP